MSVSIPFLFDPTKQHAENHAETTLKTTGETTKESQLRCNQRGTNSTKPISHDRCTISTSVYSVISGLSTKKVCIRKKFSFFPPSGPHSLSSQSSHPEARKRGLPSEIDTSVNTGRRTRERGGMRK
mmetsp:Transcript_111187/g.227603  ORF Transcript_111187/g.227603 Transcript_111187/m.227603 type:complete len:126 (-) Transcript_111187:473-850(-)